MKLFIALATLFTVASLVTGNDKFQEVDPEKPYLTELGQFAARQMSTKTYHFKLMQVQHAEQSDQIYKLRLTLQRNGDKNDLMYCTVQIQNENNNLTLENYGCTLPALVRRRRPNVQKSVPVITEQAVTENPESQQTTTTTAAPPTTVAPSSSNDDYDILSYPYDKAIQSIKNRVSEDDNNSLNDIDYEPKQKPKRHTLFVRQPIRASIPARSYFYNPRPYYHFNALAAAPSQPIVYRIQPQYQTHYQTYYQQPYYRTYGY